MPNKNAKDQQTVQGFLLASCQNIKNLNLRDGREALKKEFAAILVCNQYLKSIAAGEDVELDHYNTEINNYLYDEDLMNHLVKDEKVLNDVESLSSDEYKDLLPERAIVLADSLERARGAYKITPKVVIPEEIPYFDGFKNNLIDIRAQFAALSYADGTSVLDLPGVAPGSKRTSYGTLKRKNPIRYTQQMALLTEKLDAVIDNIDLTVYISAKTELAEKIKDADTRYKDTLNFLNEEIKQAENYEKEMRNRYLSAYELNASYIQSLPEGERNIPEKINYIYPIDKFKAAWEEASRKLSKLQNQKVYTENAYKAKSEDLMGEYRTLIQQNRNIEIQFRENPLGPEYAKNAWNDLRSVIQQIKNEAVLHEFTEEELAQDPAEGEMSNFDKLKIQNDVDTLDNLLGSITGIRKYNKQFRSIENSNKKFDEFEMKVADFFDDEYQDVDIEDEVLEDGTKILGIDSKIKEINDKLVDEDNARKLNKQDAIKLKPEDADYRDDPQNMGFAGRDDYGVLIRTTKETETEEYKRLIADNKSKENQIKASENDIRIINGEIEEHKIELNNTVNELDVKNREIDDWKYPDIIPYSHTEADFSNVEKSLNDIQQKIEDYKKAISDREKVIKSEEDRRDIELPKKAQDEQNNLVMTTNNLRNQIGELEEFNNNYKEFEEDYKKEFDDTEFKNINLDEWKDEYIKLSPEDDVDEIFKLFNQSLEDAKSIGTELSNQEYLYRKASERFKALDSFRKAATAEGITSEKQFNEADKKLRLVAADQYRKERQELIDKNQKKLDELFDRLDALDVSEPDMNTVFSDVIDPVISPDYFVSDTELSPEEKEEDEEYLEAKEVFEKHFSEWKDTVQAQAKDLIRRQEELEALEKKEEELNEAISNADDINADQITKLTNEFRAKSRAVIARLGEAEGEKYIKAGNARRELVSRLKSRHEEFEEQQDEERQESEDRLERELDEKLRDDLDMLQRKAKELAETNKKASESLIIDSFFSSELSSLIWKQGQKEAQLQYYSKQLPKDVENLTEDAQKLYLDLQNNIAKVKTEIDALKEEIATHESEREQIIDDAQKQLLSNKLAIQGQLDFLREEYDRKRQEYADSVRKEFENKQFNERDEFIAKQNEELERFDQERYSASGRLARSEIQRLREEYDKKIEPFNNEVIEIKKNYQKELSDVQDALRDKSVDTLKEEQQKLREEFINKMQLKNELRPVVVGLMTEYQKKCEDRVSDFVGKDKQNREERREILLERIENHKKDSQIELQEFDERKQNELRQFDMNVSPQLGARLEELATENDNDLKNSLSVLDRLNAERTSIPERIKLTELELKDAEEELRRAESSLDETDSLGFDDFVNNQEAVLAYESKHKENGIPGDIVSYIKQFRISRSIAKIMKADIDAWVEKNIKPEERENKNQLLTEAAFNGQAVFDEIDRRSDEEIFLNSYELDSERAEAKDKAFLKAEKEVVSALSPEMKEAYTLYSSLLDLKKAYLDVADFSEEQLRTFNDAVGISSRETLDRIRTTKSLADPNRNLESPETLNPMALYERIDLNSALYSDEAQHQIEALVISKYLADEKAATQKEMEEQRTEYDNNIKKLDREVSESQNTFNLNSNGVKGLIKDRDQKQNELDLLKKKIESESSVITATQKQLKDRNAEKTRLSAYRDLLVKLNAGEKSAVKKAKNNISLENLPQRIATAENQLKALDANIASLNKTIGDITEVKNIDVAARKTLEKELAKANKDINNISSTVKKCETALKKAQEKRNAVGEFVYTPKHPKTEEQKTKEREEKRKALILSLRDDKVFEAIEKVYEDKHKKNIASKGDIANISECRTKVEQLKLKLESLKQSRSTNKSDIVSRNENIAKRLADQVKYEVYGKGLGEEYDKAKDLVSQEEKKFIELKEKLEENKENQNKIQMQLREKLKIYNDDPFAKKDSLFKKRRLIHAAVNKISGDFEKDQQYLNKLVELEKTAYEKYIKEDPYGSLLEELSGIDSVDSIQAEANKLKEAFDLNALNSKKNLDAITQLESEIKALGEEKYDDKKKRVEAIQTLDNKNEGLKLLYAEKRILADESKRLNIMEQAQNIVKLRMQIKAQEQVVATKSASLHQVKAVEASVEQSIQELRQNLVEQSKSKTINVQSKQESIVKEKSGIESKFSTEVDAANKKISEYRQNIKNLEQQMTVLYESLANAQKLKDEYTKDNAETDEKNRLNKDESEKNRNIARSEAEKIKEKIDNKNKQIEAKNNQIISINNKINDLKASILRNNEKIAEEKRIMHLNMLAEQKAIGKRMLDLDEINKLAAKKNRLENFQKGHLAEMLAFVDKNNKVNVSNRAIIKVNVGLRESMSRLVALSKTVKKWYAGNSTQFTNMINGIKAIEKMDVTSDPATVKRLLEDARDAAQTYITVRSQDKIKTDSLLRRSRQNLAKEIVRSCTLLGVQYNLFEVDMDANNISVNKYQNNQQKMEILKQTQKDNGACSKFCELYSKPISGSKEDRFKVYRGRDEMFRNYKQNIYTDEWDKLENTVKEKYDPKNYVVCNLKEQYDKSFFESRNFALQKTDKIDLSVGYVDETVDIVEKPMIYKIYENGLAHVNKVQIDKDLHHYQFKEDDPALYSSINITEERKKFDTKVNEEISIAIEARKIQRSIEGYDPDRERQIDISKELSGFGNDGKQKNIGDNKSNRVIINDELQGFAQPKDNQPEQQNGGKKSKDKDLIV